MALISFHWRVHFADGVLEEALGSEIELRGLIRPLLVSDAEHAGSEFADRVLAGLPRRTKVGYCFPQSMRTAVDEISDSLSAGTYDTVIVFGTAGAIEAAQIAIETRRGPPDDGPVLLVVPGLDGLPCSVSRHQGEPQADRVAAAVICDPTVTLGAAADRTAKAGVDALAQCLEACLSAHYNPPADGIAFDGLRRIVSALPALIANETLALRREVMAASLSAGLTRTKGPRPSQIFCDALSEVTGRWIDQGGVKAIVLPGIVAVLEREVEPRHRERLAGLFSKDVSGSIAGGLSGFLAALPLPRQFSELDISDDELSRTMEKLSDGGKLPGYFNHLRPSGGVLVA